MKATEGMFDESVVYVTKQGSQVQTTIRPSSVRT